MSIKKEKFALRKSAIALAVVSATAMSAGFSSVAYAQTDAVQELDEVIVTGSRIKRPDLSAVSPVAVVDAEEFTISGNLNIEQKLAELPQTLPSFGPSSNNPGDGTARVDLRGLGTARTLVLVNGRRYMPSTQTGVVDLNTIPGTLIKQVDITTGGASAVYGSDALAGVVNFQLVDDFEGVEVSTLYDVTEEGDGEKFNLDLTMGGNFDNGRGNAVVYTSYSRRDSVFQGDRDFSNVALRENGTNTGLVPGGSITVPSGLIEGGPTLPNGDTLGFFLDGGDARGFTNADRFNYAPDNFLQLPQERFLISGMAHFDINEKMRAYSEVAFARNQVDAELAPTPAGPTNVVLNPDSAFFSPAVQQALNTIRTDTNGDGVVNGEDNVTVSRVRRRLVENGPRQNMDTRTGNRILVGLKGDLSENWSYDAFYSRSELDRINVLNNDAAASRFRQAILVTDDGTACQNPSGGCVPLNVFGAGNISEAAANFIKVGATNVTNIQQQVLQASVSGTLGTVGSASAPVGLVVGAEYREDESEFRPDAFLSSGDVLGFNAGQSTKGGFDVTELFTEISVPITDQFEMWGAGRYSDYSTIGGVGSFATALKFKPTDKLDFRIGYQQAVRAPNVNELFLGSSNGFPSATDPCSVGGFNPGTTDAALCAATGVPAALVGNFTQSNAQIEGRFGGNSQLIEESSDTFTVGMVFQPNENWDITLDYYKIEIEDAISVLGGSVNNVLDICYNQVQDASSAFCQAITRTGDGNVNIVSVLNENISDISTSGIDFNVNYAQNYDWGINGEGSTLSWSFRSTYLLESDLTPVAELDTVNECAGNFGNTCGTAQSELVFNSRVTWSSGPWSVSSLLRYLSSVDDDRIENNNIDPNTLVVPEIDDEFYLDLSASYRFSDDFKVNFGIKNVLDTEPTALGGQQEQANTFPSVYDLLGPRVFLSGSYRFR
ncbi:TonB-dependent receptor [Arenicella sp. 4NH20-0111]|uniref:TonB-dependent receptor plug domain-containing protein n=1 Tax=Arenicella sp. 4NH20-0111 TaxID=3127648 RepID=UPI00310860DF